MSDIEHIVFYKRIKIALFFPFIFIVLIWGIKILESITDMDFGFLGVYPLHLSGLIGIITSPFIHGDFEHLYSNTLPIIILGSGIFFFYQDNALKIILSVWITTGVLVWIIARESYHIGASGLIYGFASFLFFGGILSKKIPLIAISLLVVFLYGGIIWGIFPLKTGVSWESHLMGFVSGIIFAIVFNKREPDSIEESDIDNDNEFFHSTSTDTSQEINYNYVEKNNQDE